MNHVFLAEGAEFLVFNPSGLILFVLRCRVITLFAYRAFQRYDITHVADAFVFVLSGDK
jgi:hypothetical protein